MTESRQHGTQWFLRIISCFAQSLDPTAKAIYYSVARSSILLLQLPSLVIQLTCPTIYEPAIQVLDLNFKRYDPSP